jgi:hypothetical protein
MVESCHPGSPQIRGRFRVALAVFWLFGVGVMAVWGSLSVQVVIGYVMVL